MSHTVSISVSIRTKYRFSSFAVALAALILGTSSLVHAQGPHVLTQADQDQIEALIQKMSPEQKLDYIGGTGFAVRAVPELNLPPFEMSDGPVGVRSNGGFPSTTYAGGIGLAASWDRELAAKIGAGIGRDARARGINYMLGPGTNIYRSPRNGRNFEYFGEDPFLASEMVVGYVTGMQREGVSATVKHYLGNNSEFLRHDSDTEIDERTAREIYLPAFEAAVRRGNVGAIMDSYNLINGKHATENPYFNIDIARKEWGFKGTLMSDWVATYNAVGAANGGLDIEMPTGKFMNRANLMPALKSGEVSQATIDDKVRHILTTAMMFGWLTRSQRDTTISVYNAQGNATALQSARESAVLLKNTGSILPLDRAQIKTILLVGPDAYPGSPVGGGSAAVAPFHNISLLEGLSTLGSTIGVKILYDPGLPTLSDLAAKTGFMTAVNGGKGGLLLETFTNKDLSGAATRTTVPHVNETGLGWDLISGNLEDLMALFQKLPKSVSHRYTGYYDASTTGTYLIALAGAGEGNGDRVYLDGKVVIDDWDLVRAFEPHVLVPLKAGMHKVVVESWQSGPLGGKLRLGIEREDSLVSEQVKQLAAKADVVIIAAGFSTTKDNDSEGEGGDRTFDLPYGQDVLIRTMAAINAKTVVTITSGGNVDSATWIDKVPALIEGWYGGQAGGQAMAEILFGEVNPSGHLPATFERRAEDNPSFNTYYPETGTRKVTYKEGIFIGYRGYEKGHVQPLFPFGFGLSYTTFAYKNMKVSPSSPAGLAQVEFDVSNTGQRKGADVAQIYVSDDHAPIQRPIHELKGFERIELAPGETRHVVIGLDARAFAYYDIAKKTWTIDPGTFKIEAGDSLASLPLSATFAIGEDKARVAHF